MALQLQKRLFTVVEYHQMEEAGILNEDDRVELIEGEIVEMNPIGSRHAATVDRLAQLLFQRAGGHAIVRVQNPVQLGERSEPQPDLALLKPRPDFYAGAHPGPDDVILLVEVVDSSADYDREVKLPLYARAGVPEVWLIDLETRTVEVHRHPSGPSAPSAPSAPSSPSTPSGRGYGETARVARGQALSVRGLPELRLDADLILG